MVFYGVISNEGGKDELLVLCATRETASIYLCKLRLIHPHLNLSIGECDIKGLEGEDEDMVRRLIDTIQKLSEYGDKRVVITDNGD